jgi:hypothetical protein
MSASAPPVTIRLWARSSWWLVGNGPSYLLFLSKERRVIHLTKQLPRNLREALKGFQATENGTLVPLVHALSLINTGMLRSSLKSRHRLRCSRASLTVLDAIEHLIYHCPEEKSFENQLARFTSNIRAARRFGVAEIEFAGGDEFAISEDEKRGIFWIRDSRGREVMITDCTDPAGAQDSFRCVPYSPIARATQALWDREQQSFGDRASCLYRVPTRKELREELLLDEPAVTKLCRAEGFGWLPKASVRASKTRTGLRPSLWAA